MSNFDVTLNIDINVGIIVGVDVGLNMSTAADAGFAELKGIVSKLAPIAVHVSMLVRRAPAAAAPSTGLGAGTPRGCCFKQQNPCIFSSRGGLPLNLFISQRTTGRRCQRTTKIAALPTLLVVRGAGHHGRRDPVGAGRMDRAGAHSGGRDLQRAAERPAALLLRRPVRWAERAVRGAAQRMCRP